MYAVYADQMPVRACYDDLDKEKLKAFLEGYAEDAYSGEMDACMRLLYRMNLAADEHTLTMAGLLLLGRGQDYLAPHCVICAGRVTTEGQEDNSAEIMAGDLPSIRSSALRFAMDAVKQAGGEPAECIRTVLDELLVNALLHRDYFKQEAIRLIIRNNYIELINPGCLPEHMPVERIDSGAVYVRNPILTAFCGRGLLPYSGLGLGIQRCLRRWPHIMFFSNLERNEFCVRLFFLPRTTRSGGGAEAHCTDASAPALNSRPKIILSDNQNRLLRAIRATPKATYAQLARTTGLHRCTITRHVKIMKKAGLLKRVGSKKTGSWSVAAE